MIEGTPGCLLLDLDSGSLRQVLPYIYFSFTRDLLNLFIYFHFS
jgi:hypothetical protein